MHSAGQARSGAADAEGYNAGQARSGEADELYHGLPITALVKIASEDWQLKRIAYGAGANQIIRAYGDP
jgi:hypothetical protein